MTRYIGVLEDASFQFPRLRQNMRHSSTMTVLNPPFYTVSVAARRRQAQYYGTRIGCADVLMYAQISEPFGAEDPGSCSSLWASIHFQYELAL
jgi:hypothetical protein